MGVQPFSLLPVSTHLESQSAFKAELCEQENYFVRLHFKATHDGTLGSMAQMENIVMFGTLAK